MKTHHNGAEGLVAVGWAPMQLVSPINNWTIYVIFLLSGM